MTRSRPSYLSRLDRLPPVVCWMIARRGRRGNDSRPRTLLEIAAAAHVHPHYLQKVVGRLTWKGMKIETIDAIRAACGIIPSNEADHLQYLKRTLHLARDGWGFTSLRRRPSSARRRIHSVLTRDATDTQKPVAG